MDAVRHDNPFAAAPRGDNPFAKITDNVSRIVEAERPPKAWYIAFGIALTLLTIFLTAITYLAWEGIGVWGNMIAVAWA